MKKLIFVCMAAFLSLTVSAQTKATKDSKGNYIAVKSTTDTTGSKAKSTGKTFTDAKGKVYPLYISEKGKLFINRISQKTNKAYKQYITID